MEGVFVVGKGGEPEDKRVPAAGRLVDGPPPPGSESRAAREAFIRREHPVAGPIALLAPWIRLSETPSSIRQMSPRVGQHTEEVLQDLLGWTPTVVEDLRRDGAVR